jgi:hypothetical protein
MRIAAQIEIAFLDFPLDEMRLDFLPVFIKMEGFGRQIAIVVIIDIDEA